MEIFSEYSIFVVDSEKYKLDSINDGNGVSYMKKWSGYNVSFSAKKGKATYIGDFIFNSKDGTLEIVDNYEDAKAEIEKHHPELARKLDKKIAERPYLYFNGYIKIIEVISRSPYYNWQYK